jgi:hypothetical protein
MTTLLAIALALTGWDDSSADGISVSLPQGGSELVAKAGVRAFSDQDRHCELDLEVSQYRGNAQRTAFERELQRRVDEEKVGLPDGVVVKPGTVAPYEDGFAAEYAGVDREERAFAGRLLMAHGMLLLVYLNSDESPAKTDAMRLVLFRELNISTPAAPDAGRRGGFVPVAEAHASQVCAPEAAIGTLSGYDALLIPPLRTKLRWSPHLPES